MAIYRASWSIAGVNTADQVLFNLKTVGSDRAVLRAAGMFITTAPTNAPQFGLKRMLAVGTGAITLATAMISDPADGAAASGLETLWATTRPTVTGGYGALASVANAIGNGIIFDFSNRGIVVPVTAGLCGVISNASGATLGAHNGWVEWEE